MGQGLCDESFAKRELSPQVDAGIVYFLPENGNLYALDAASGEELWRYATGYGVNIYTLTRPSPLLVEGAVYIDTVDGFVVALDAATGEQIQQLPPAGFGLTTSR